MGNKIAQLPVPKAEVLPSGVHGVVAIAKIEPAKSAPLRCVLHSYHGVRYRSCSKRITLVLIDGAVIQVEIRLVGNRKWEAKSILNFSMASFG